MKREIKRITIIFILSEIIAFLFLNIATYFHNMYGNSIYESCSLLMCFIFMLLPLAYVFYDWYKTLE